MQVLYFEDATATFDAFSGKHEVIKFKRNEMLWNAE